MRRTLIVLSVTLLASIDLAAQTPPSAPAAPRQPARAAAARPSAFIIQVTDRLGAPLQDVQVEITGPVAREGVTGPDGSLRVTNMRAGNYRLRFTREGSIGLERDVTVRAGESPTIEVSLSPAPVAPKAPEPVPPPPPEPETKSLPPAGDPRVTPVPLFLEKNFIGGREGRRESILGCTATGGATLHQLREAWASHTHDDGDEWIYVVAGEGTLRIGTADHRLQAGTFALVPHSTAHAVMPQGRNPLIIISMLSGPRCQA